VRHIISHPRNGLKLSVDITSANMAVSQCFKTMCTLRQHGANFYSCISATLATRSKPNRVVEVAGRL
jgi:hypothetical protein